MKADIQATMARIAKLIPQRYEERQAGAAELIKSAAKAVPCRTHPCEMRPIDPEATLKEFRLGRSDNRAIYEACRECVEDAEAERMKACGVPDLLSRATFDNWEPKTAEDEANLGLFKRFVTEVRCGFLVAVGPKYGTGKSHLCAAAMRHWPSAKFIRQSALLQALRASYRDAAVRNPTEGCQAVGLLVLDDMGISGGGRDELPMLHEILEHRHGERMATILSSNFETGDLESMVGARMSDRLSQSTFAVCHFTGQSRRRDHKPEYFSGIEPWSRRGEQ